MMQEVVDMEKNQNLATKKIDKWIDCLAGFGIGASLISIKLSFYKLFEKQNKIKYMYDVCI